MLSSTPSSVHCTSDWRTASHRVVRRLQHPFNYLLWFAVCWIAWLSKNAKTTAAFFLGFITVIKRMFLARVWPFFRFYCASIYFIHILILPFVQCFNAASQRNCRFTGAFKIALPLKTSAELQWHACAEKKTRNEHKSGY